MLKNTSLALFGIVGILHYGHFCIVGIHAQILPLQIPFFPDFHSEFWQIVSMRKKQSLRPRISRFFAVSMTIFPVYT